MGADDYRGLEDSLYGGEEQRLGASRVQSVRKRKD